MSERIFRAIGIERLRLVNDGEGVTTLVAGTGCPLRCRYCLNPQCFENTVPVRAFTVDELLRETSVDDLYFQATGGGIVFGGGEPLLQADFIHAFRSACPSGWRISLESSLAVPGQELEKVISDIDFFLIDIKDMNPEIYRNYTGQDNSLVKANLKILKEAGMAGKTKIRIPLIPEFNADSDRKASMEECRQMGFEDFDVFTYEVQRALKKRKNHDL